MTLPLHVEDTGAGSPIVALHGFGASVFTWRDVIGTMAASHRVYAVDLKGAGQSPKPSDGLYSMRDQAALILDLIDQRQLRGLTLVGHSFGGGVALLTALALIQTRPGVLTSLVLFDAPAYRQPFPWFINSLRVPVLGPLSQWVLPLESQVRQVLRTAFEDDDLVTGAIVQAYAAPLRMAGGRSALRETAKQIVPPDIDTISAQYGSIDVPTLLVWGRQDAIVPLATGERLHNAIASSRLVVIDRCGHVPHEEAPDRVRPILSEFLRTHAVV